MDKEDRHAREAEVRRASEAQRIIEHPLWVETWKRYEQNVKDCMFSAASSDETVLEARKNLKVLNRVRADLEKMLKTGEMAQLQLDKDRANAA